MIRNGRIGLLALAAVIAVVVFVLARPEESSRKADDPSTNIDQTLPTQGREGEPTATAESAPPPPPTEIRLSDGQVEGGVQKIEARTGNAVRFLVISDTPYEIHLHGYDVEKQAAPGRPARFRIETGLEGVFEIESHAAEDSGSDSVIARLVVEA